MNETNGTPSNNSLPWWSLNIYKTRRQRRLSRKGLAKIAGMGEGTIKKLENGDGLIASYLRICEALGVHPAEMARRPA